MKDSVVEIEPCASSDRTTHRSPPLLRPRRYALVALTFFAIGAGLQFWIQLPIVARQQQPPVLRSAALPIEDVPGLQRADGTVTVPPGSPYRNRMVVATVDSRTLEQTRTVPATVEADPSRVFNVLPPLGGRVTEVGVRLGDHVSVGQKLAVLDSGDLAQAYADADKSRAQLGLARRALERARGLSQAGGGAAKDVESAGNDAAQAEAETNRAQARLKAIAGSAGISGTRTLTVSAPISGAVTALSTAAGAYINDATQSMMTISNLDTVWVTANVPETDIGFVSKGQKVNVSFIAYPGEVFPGTVLFVNDLMEPDTRRTKVRISFDNVAGRFKPNMFASVTLHAPARTALFVPDSALLMNNDATTIFVETAPWTFVRKPVQTGYAVGGSTVISGGLLAGERIVTRGGVLLND